MEIAVFVVYLLFMLGIGVYFFFKNKTGGEKTYFLGNRQMGPWVSALSAGASDMSAWVLMGLPTSIYAFGLGQIWIPIGLVIGYSLSWIFEARRLRRFSIVSNDSITIPQYLTNRFLNKSKILQVCCAVVFLFAYTIYAASSIKACGTLFNIVIGIDVKLAMILSAIIIVGYTFLGGFNAVCWTDFFQGMLILAAMLVAPIFALNSLNASNSVAIENKEYFNLFTNYKDIISGLGWGLGYFGMPHIIIRFMSIKSDKAVKQSAIIGICWTTLICSFSVLIAIVGRHMFGLDQSIVNNELVFVSMVRKIFPALVIGILLSAVLAASMSTADSQLLAASSAFASDVYKPVFRKNKASNKEIMWVGRAIVLIIAIVALLIALNPNTGNIMSLVSNAWGLFGSAFGAVILLSLYWKRFNFKGAVFGILVGAVVDILWLCFLSNTGIYEIIPGFVSSLLVAIVVTLLTNKPSDEVIELFDKAINIEN